jgi:hypothetical protein
MGNPRQQRILFQKKYVYSVHTGFGAHPASYQMGTEGSIPGDIAAWVWS